MQKIQAAIAAALTAGSLSAAPLTVCDFENYDIGTKWTLWHSGGSSTATVETDPVNPANKVLHIVLKEWGAIRIYPPHPIARQGADRPLHDGEI